MLKMTTIFKFKKSFKSLIITLFALTVFSSCQEDNYGIRTNAFIRVVNASEGSLAQDFYLDSAKLNSSAVAYTQSSAYLKTTDGNKLGRFKTAGTTQVNSSATLNIDGGKYYTVYYIGGTSTSATFATLDEVVAVSTSKAKVRFIHLSTAVATNVDLAVQGGEKIVSNLAYKAASSYQEINANTNFQLFTTGSLTGAISLPALSLQAGKIYTVYITGNTTATLRYNVLVDKE